MVKDTSLEQVYLDVVKTLPTRAPIYLPTEKMSLAERLEGVRRVARIYQHALDKTYRPQLRALRNKYMGHRRCFLIGNGPSLNRTDLSVLKDEVTFAVNGFFLKAEELDWTPTFYCVEDHLVAEDRRQWINSFSGPTKLFPAYLAYALPEATDTIFYNHHPRVSYPNGFDFSLDADEITYTGCTVTFSLMQLAVYMGFREIYLIGVDASYDLPKDVKEVSAYGTGVLDMESDDPNHFNPDYFGKGFRWHDPQVEKMVEAYQEARKTLEGTEQTVYNATVGGKLEVFERRSFASLFPNALSPEDMDRQAVPLSQQNKDAQLTSAAALDAGQLPRLLVLDMTAMGNGSATGEIKARLLMNWPRDRLLQIASPRNGNLDAIRPCAKDSFIVQNLLPSEVQDAIDTFAPEVILYRPVPTHSCLHDFAMETIRGSDLPLVTWIMDDWPAKLEYSNPALFRTMDRDLRWLLRRSGLRLSISDAMAHAFELRYCWAFMSFANGIDPELWAQVRSEVLPSEPPETRSVLVRYAGGMARDMNADSLVRIAQAVENRRRAGQDVRFEISTNPHWQKFSGHLFHDFEGTSIDTELRPHRDYMRWLAEADVLVIAYNFDKLSRRYIRYSMANKMPECLISGAAVLAHGPRGVATIDYLADCGCVDLVDQAEEAALEEALKRLADPKHRQTLADAARDIALSRHDLRRLADGLGSVIATTPALTPPESDADLARTLPSVRFYRGRSGAPPLPADASDLKSAARDGDTILMVYWDVRERIAAVISTDGDASTILEDWTRDLEEALKHYRSLRQQTMVMEAGVMLRCPAIAAAVLAGHGVVLPRDCAALTPPVDPMLLALANASIGRTHPAWRLLSELDASRQPMPEETERQLDLLRTASIAWRVGYAAKGEMMEELVRLHAELTESRKAKEELSDRLHAELTESRKAKEELSDRLHAELTGRRTAEKELSRQGQRLSVLEKKLVRRRQRLDKKATRCTNLEAELGRLRHELNEVHDSISWRITSPVRRASLLLRQSRRFSRSQLEDGNP